MDAAFRGLRTSLDAPSRAKLAAAGLNLDKPLLPAYPRDVFVEAIAIAAPAVHLTLPAEFAYRLLGRVAVDSMRETLLGWAQLALARTIGPMRALLKIGKNVRDGGSQSDATTRQIDDRTGVMTLLGYGLPYAEYHLVAIEAVLDIFERPGKLEVLSFVPEQKQLEVRVTLE